MSQQSVPALYPDGRESVTPKRDPKPWPRTIQSQ